MRLWSFGELWENVKLPFPADQVKSLSQAYEGYVEGFVLFSAFLLMLTEGENHVHCRGVCWEATMKLRIDLINKFLETY